jgi:hypothetical protein
MVNKLGLKKGKRQFCKPETLNSYIATHTSAWFSIIS